MKHSPVVSSECREFSYLSSTPWRRLPGRISTPWIGFDPELRSDCSAACRAFRLVMLALFALLGASSRVQAQSSNQTEPGTLESTVKAQGRQNTALKALRLRPAQSLQSQQQISDKLENGLGEALPTRPFAEDRRESAHLKVNRTHAPPPAHNPSTEPSPAQSEIAAVTNPLLPSPQLSSPTDSPLQFKIGGAYFTPFGFIDFTGVFRNHDTGDGIATAFASIPYGANNYQNHLSELRFSSQYSRIGLRLDALVKGMRLIGYMEADFLGSSPGNLAVSTNSNTLRSPKRQCPHGLYDPAVFAARNSPEAAALGCARPKFDEGDRLCQQANLE